MRNSTIVLLYYGNPTFRVNLDRHMLNFYRNMNQKSEEDIKNMETIIVKFSINIIRERIGGGRPFYMDFTDYLVELSSLWRTEPDFITLVRRIMREKGFYHLMNLFLGWELNVSLFELNRMYSLFLEGQEKDFRIPWIEELVGCEMSQEEKEKWVDEILA